MGFEVEVYTTFVYICSIQPFDPIDDDGFIRSVGEKNVESRVKSHMPSHMLDLDLSFIVSTVKHILR